MSAGYDGYPEVPRSWWHMRERPSVALRLAIATLIWFGSLVAVFTLLPLVLR